MKKTKLLPYLFILSLVACCVEVDISVPGFPEMSEFFAVSDGMIQATIAINFLGFFLASLVYGPLSESYGRRNTMLAGNFILSLGATGCIFAPSIYWLLAARFIQGLGAATSAVVVFAMISDIYSGNKAVRLIALMNSILTTIMAIAPVLGGFINKAIGWRGNYGSVALVCFVSWSLLYLLLPETKKDLEDFDIKRIVKDYGHLLSSLIFVNASCVPSLLYSAYMSFVACAAFLYMETFGMSITVYSLHQASIVASFSLISILSDKIIRLLGERISIIAGMLLCSIGSVALLTLSLFFPYSPYLVTSSMTIFSIGFAICYPIIFLASLEIFPKAKGTASSAIMGMRACLCSGMVGLTGYFYDGQPITIAFAILSVVALVLVFTIYLFYSCLLCKAPHPAKCVK